MPRLVRLALGASLGLTASCLGEPGAGTDGAPIGVVSGEVGDDLPEGADGLASIGVCTRGRFRCHAQVRASRGVARAAAAAAPAGYGPSELQAAYDIDPAVLVADRPTVAIVDAYGYAALEADLAIYRAQYGLPPCTVANGCLKIVNQRGQATPLPPNPPADDDWTVETALDADMVSAACPRCNILVVQADDNVSDGLLIAQNAAASLGATVISNSWGGPENPRATPAQMAAAEAYFNHPSIAIFVAAGDNGYNDTLVPPGTDTGPDYPATSAHTIAVGGTRLVRDASPRGWRETAWAMGGSACSLSIAKPAYQTASPCAYKATADIAAVGDPETGMAVYNARNGGWLTVGGTSAAAPFVAAIFAANGHGGQSSGSFIAGHADKLYDVTTGSNGACGANTLLCNAASGWDGPTGYGTPSAARLRGAAVTRGAGDDVSGGCAAGRGPAGGWLAVAALALGRRRRRRVTA